ncbi:MAG: hypothetical protein NVS2B11_17680 [Acetobacteraceae bacterium]
MKPIQVAGVGRGNLPTLIVALCDDGSILTIELATGSGWRRLPQLPQPEPAPTHGLRADSAMRFHGTEDNPA